MRKRRGWKGVTRTRGRSVPPRGARTGCNCPDGSYSPECCDGSTLWAFGIGNITGVRKYVVDCSKPVDCTANLICDGS